MKRKARIEELGALDTAIDPEEAVAASNDEALRNFNLPEETDTAKAAESDN